MITNESSSTLHRFSWEEWDDQIFVVLYRSERRFVVKRYIERVLANSSQWQQISQFSFANIEPIPQAFSMHQDEVKLMHQIFAWHFNGTLKFPIIAGLDQLIDWEDVLDFIERAKQAIKHRSIDETFTLKSPSLVPTIPVGFLSSSSSKSKKTIEKKKSSEDLESNKTDQTTGKTQDENTSRSLTNHWVQINNICVPYIIKSHQIRLLPYDVLLDCELLSEEEQDFLHHFTILASINDKQMFERIISSSSSMDFTLAPDLRLIDLYQLIFGMSKVAYVKLLYRQRDVNKSYRTVLAHIGGTVNFRSHSIPFIHLNRFDYILLDSLVITLKPTSKILSVLRRRGVPAQPHEIDYLRLVQFYQRRNHQDDEILLNSTEPQLLISINDVHKYIDDGNFQIDLSLTDYQQGERKRLANHIKINDDKPTIRKATKRKASNAMNELKNMATERS